MNLSGESVAEVMNFYKLDPDEEMIVILMIFRSSRGVSVSVKGQRRMVTTGLRVSLQMTGTQGFQPYQGRCWRKAAGLGSC